MITGGMVLRIGEAMVGEGIITNEQLAKALERQIIFGGRLGTNLVEMGLISEEALAKFLSKVLRVPYAEPVFFEDVGQDVLDSISRELVEKHTAFPIRRERNRLHLAMKDPNDIAAVDELRFVVGLDIRPYIASEMRIAFAMEKYYGVKRDIRYVAVQGAEKTFDNPGGAPGMTASASAQPKHVTPDLSEEEYLGDESQMDYYSESIFGKPAEAAPAPLEAPIPAQPPIHAAPPPPPSPSPPPAPPVQAAPVVAAPPEVHAPPPPTPVYQAPVHEAQPVPPAPLKPVRGPYDVLANPDDREQIAGAILTAALSNVGRAALFLVKGAALSGWRAGGQNLADQTVSKVAINLSEPSMFKDVVEDRVFYKGPILQIPQNNQLMAALGGFYPQEAFACPLIIKGKVVAVLYVDNGQGSFITGNVEKLTSLMSKASMSLEILILKTKILAEGL